MGLEPLEPSKSSRGFCFVCFNAWVTQLVECRREEPKVSGSNPFSCTSLRSEGLPSD